MPLVQRDIRTKTVRKILIIHLFYFFFSHLQNNMKNASKLLTPMFKSLIIKYKTNKKATPKSS